MPWVPIVGSGVPYNFVPNETGPTPPSLDSDSLVISFSAEGHPSNSYGSWGIEPADLGQTLRLRATVMSFSFTGSGVATAGSFYYYSSAVEGFVNIPNELSAPDYFDAFEPSVVELAEGDETNNFQFIPPIPEGGGTFPSNFEVLVEVWVDGAEPTGCFWEGLVMATEDCGDGDVDPPDGDWLPEFGHREPTATPGIFIYREDFCDMDVYNEVQAGGVSFLLTHIGVRGGADAEDGWECGDGPTAEPTWILLGEPMYMDRFLDGSDAVAWSLPFTGSIPGALGEYYGFVDLRITVENAAVITQLEGVGFAMPES